MHFCANWFYCWNGFVMGPFTWKYEVNNFQTTFSYFPGGSKMGGAQKYEFFQNQVYIGMWYTKIFVFMSMNMFLGPENSFLTSDLRFDQFYAKWGSKRAFLGSKMDKNTFASKWQKCSCNVTRNMFLVSKRWLLLLLRNKLWELKIPYGLDYTFLKQKKREKVKI